MKYVKSICSCEHTVIIMAVNIHRLIYLRTYFSFYAKQEGDMNSSYLVKEAIAWPEQDLALSNAGPNIAKRLGKVSRVLWSSQRCFERHQNKLQMWRSFGLRPHATSHWRCSRAAMAVVSARLREGLAETRRRKMYVKITCLQDTLYKATNLSVLTSAHTGYKLCKWWRKIHFSCWLHWGLYQWVVSLVDVLWSFMSQCKAPKEETQAMTFLLFWKLDCVYIFEETLQYTNVTSHLKHFNIHTSDRKWLDQGSIDHCGICHHAQSPKAIPNLSLSPSTKHFEQPVFHSNPDICTTSRPLNARQGRLIRGPLATSCFSQSSFLTLCELTSPELFFKIAITDQSWADIYTGAMSPRRKTHVIIITLQLFKSFFRPCMSEIITLVQWL